jgi:hypothetical protein
MKWKRARDGSYYADAPSEKCSARIWPAVRLGSGTRIYIWHSNVRGLRNRGWTFILADAKKFAEWPPQ